MHSNKKQKGFTLIEIIISTAILSAVIFSAAFFFMNIYEFTSLFSKNLEVQQEIQETLVLIIPEIRSMNFSNTGSYPISSASTNTLILYNDVDNDGLVERIKYFATGTKLMKGFLKPSGTPPVYLESNEKIKIVVNDLMLNPSENIFSFFDSNGAPMSNPPVIANIRMIRVSIEAKRADQITPIKFSINITPRNLRTL